MSAEGSCNNITFVKEYERYRPSYPISMVETVAEKSRLQSSEKVLEIGCGTGKATILFATLGYEIHCIDPDRESLIIAIEKLKNYKNVSFYDSSFENWCAREKSFALVFAAQSFHRIDPNISYQKVKNVLQPRGHIALFWNAQKEDTDFSQKENKIYIRYFGSKATGSYSEIYRKSVSEAKKEIDSTGFFEKAELLEFSYHQEYSREEYLGLQKTYSSYQNFAATKRVNIFQDIGNLIDKMGGKITVPYTTVVIFAKKVKQNA